VFCRLKCGPGGIDRGYPAQGGIYYATNPNGTKLDNYSTIGNVNPWTGKPGWIRPDGTATTSREVPTSNYLPQEVPILSTAPVPSGANSKSVAVVRPDRTIARRSAAVGPVPDEGELYSVPVANPYHPHWTVGRSN